MNKFNARTISTHEVAERLIEMLDDLFNENLISGPVLRKKRSFKTVLRAINHADRIVSRNMQLSAQVVIYSPPGEAVLDLTQQGNFQGDIAADLLEQVDLDPQTRAMFIEADAHLHVLEITSRYLDVFESYPAQAQKSEHRIRKVSPDDFSRDRDGQKRRFSHFHGRFYGDLPHEPVCYYLPSQQRLVLGQDVENPAFLRFTARIMPGILNVADVTDDKCDFKIYNIVSPHDAFEYLIYEAMLQLIPMTASEARNLVLSLRNQESIDYLTTKPTDSNVVVPRMSFG